MRTALVAGNWKMHGTRAGIESLVTEITRAGPFDCQTLICPPYVFFDRVRVLIAETSVAMGAQNVDWHDEGAFTGEVSATMVAEAGCQYSLVGHSERRHYYGESDDIVVKKYSACLKAGLTPILCVGETLTQRRANETADVVGGQLGAVMDACGMEAVAGGIVAYEPVWAIGTGETATPDQAEAVHAQLRELIARRDINIAENIRILYGGSVNAGNAAGLFEKQNIDGALVGGASLKAAEFVAICRAAG